MVRLGSALVPAVDELTVPDAMIVIVTHNRREEATNPVASAAPKAAAEPARAQDRVGA
jgi:hypothetical protein